MTGGTAMPILRAELDCLDAMFDAVETARGSVDAYLERVLGIGAAMRKAIRSELLEELQA